MHRKDAWDELCAATSGAVKFLLQAQDANGSWKDFLLPAGNSNVWVTGFVGNALAGINDASAQASVKAGWQFLERNIKDGKGWSYNPTVPGDADSTLWALRFAEALGLDQSSSARGAAQFIEEHVRDDGGLATYASAGPIQKYIGVPAFVPFEGWTQSHICVTAACANLGKHCQRFQSYLLAKQADDGRWPAYWWFDDEYATAEAVAAFVGKGRTVEDCGAEIALPVARAVDWALGRAGKIHGENIFALAHVLRILARSNREDVQSALMKGLAELIAMQKMDGSWPASSKLRVPRPDVLMPDVKAKWRMWTGMPPGAVSLHSVLEHTFTIYSLDHYAVYTTATALYALQEIVASPAWEGSTEVADDFTGGKVATNA